MEVIVIIGSLRLSKWVHLRHALRDVNHIEISSDLIYTSWNKEYVKTSSLASDGKNIDSHQINSVVERPWFLNLVQRWCCSAICDYSLYLSECIKFETALIHFLKQFSIKKSICLYGIAHHVWNNIAESSLFNLGVESIKFYPFLDTQHCILLSGANEINLPCENKALFNELQPNIPNIHDILVRTLVESRPKYTSHELELGRYYVDYEKELLVQTLKFALCDIKRSLKSLFVKQCHQFSFSSLLPSNRYSLISKSINLVSQSQYISAYKQISQPLCLDSLRGQLLLFAHFQPEATTSPEGGSTWNHLELVAKLKRKFPHLKIFYKEHPASALAFDSSKSATDVGLCRSVAYLDALQALGVTMLDLDSSVSVDTMKNFDVIPVTISGTVALQSAMSGHYAIYSGLPIYKHFSSSLPLYDLDHINSDTFLESLQANSYPNTDMLMANFLKNVAPFLLPNLFGFGFGPPVSDSYHVAARIKILRVLIDSQVTP